MVLIQCRPLVLQIMSSASERHQSRGVFDKINFQTERCPEPKTKMRLDTVQSNIEELKN